MSLKLMLAVLAVYCVAVAFAPPPPPPPPPPPGFVERDINRQEATAQQVCDDTCLLCELVLNYEYPAQTSKKESNLNQFMSAIQLLSGRIQHRGKRQSITTKESCLDVCSLCYSSVVMRQKRNVNRLASAEQVCDDPCTLCGLLLKHMFEELDDYPAAKQQKSFNEQSKLEKILSLAKIQRPPNGKREAVVSEDFLSLARIERPPVGKREAVVSEDFLSLARIERPPIGKREAVVSEDTCIDVCGECSAAKKKKAREQTKINAILEMLLSQ